MADYSAVTFYGFIQNFHYYENYMTGGYESLARSTVKPNELKVYEALHNYLQTHPAAKPEMQKLYVDSLKFFDHPQMTAWRADESTKSNPTDVWKKGLDNLTGGFIGALFQGIGQLIHPNDAQKATELGNIGKTVGDLAEAAAAFKADPHAYLVNKGDAKGPIGVDKAKSDKDKDQLVKDKADKDPMTPAETYPSTEGKAAPQPEQGSKTPAEKVIAEVMQKLESSTASANKDKSLDKSMKDKAAKQDPSKDKHLDGFDHMH